MNKVKKLIKKVLKVFGLKEIKILPAYLSYSFVLASMPILTIIVLVASWFSISIDSVINLIRELLPSYVSTNIINVISGKEYDLSIGFLNLFTFCVAANGMYAVIEASNSLYKIDSKTPVKDRFRSVIILLIIISLLLFLIVVPMLGDKIIELLSNYELFNSVKKEIYLIYSAVKWPITFLVIFCNIKLIYVIAPSIRIKSEDTTLGAFVTTVGWLCFTAIFGYYIKYFARYDLLYGSLAGITILLIWIYILSFILILGIVINSKKYNRN